MNIENSPNRGWLPLPPVRFIHYSRRIGWLNFTFALIYLFYFLRSVGKEVIDNLSEQGIPIYFEIIAYFVSFTCLLLGGIFLLKKKRLGKRLTYFVGITGLLTIGVFGVWSLTILWMPEFEGYPFIVLGNSIRLIVRYTLRFAYPILVSLILLKRTDEELGLE